jgi:hypothetical protein
MSSYGDQERRESITSALRVYDENGERRTDPVTIKGQRQILKVIRVNPKMLLLNHDSFRLAGQLRDLDMREKVHANPTSLESQRILEDLLRSTSDYNKLLDDLKRSGQDKPGLITRDGLLINGNTRVVALRELGVTGVDVAVLPEDVTHQDFLDLEVEFQMRVLTHQEYTYTNQLLMISELSHRGLSDADIARKMSWQKRGKEKVRQALRILGLIDEIRELKPGQLPYKLFDAKKQHLIDLDSEYQRLSALDPSAANNMKWARVFAIFLGATKDQVREIDEDFIESHVANRVDENSQEILAATIRKKPSEDDDLDGLIEPDDDVSAVDPKQLVTKLFAQQFNSDEDPENLGNTDAFHDIAEAVRLGADAIIQDNKYQSMVAAPADVLRETRLSLEKLLEKFSELATMDGFDISKFGYELKKVSKVIEQIETVLKSQ